MKSIKFSIHRGTFRMMTAVAALALPVLALAGVVHAATLSTASVTLDKPQINSTTVKYDFLTSNVTTATTIRCVKLVFSAASDGSGGVPTGMDTSVGAVSVNTAASDFFTSHAGWTLDKSTNGTLEYTNATGDNPDVGTAANFVVDGVTNGSQANDDKYLTLSTYTNVNCSTGPTDSVTVGFIFTDGQEVSASVDASLTFAVSGVTGNGALTIGGATITNGLATTSSTIPFGTVTASVNKVAAQDLTVSTNSGLGYTVSTRYTGAPTTGTYTISDLATHTNASPGSFSSFGTEAFGYTTNDALLGTGTTTRFSTSDKWAAFSTTNAEVAYHNAAVANQTTRVGYQIGVSGSTEPGTYLSTVIYTATPVY